MLGTTSKQPLPCSRHQHAIEANPIIATTCACLLLCDDDLVEFVLNGRVVVVEEGEEWMNGGDIGFGRHC